MSETGDRYGARIAELMASVHSRTDPLGVLAACCAIGEAFAHDVLHERIEATGMTIHPLGAFMLSELASSRTSSWKARTAWLSATGLDRLGSRTWYQDFLLMTEARNAALHGNGRLTTRQSTVIAQLIPLRQRLSNRLGIPLFGSDLQLDRTDIRRLIGVAGEFIVGLDFIHDKTEPVRCSLLASGAAGTETSNGVQ